MITLALSLFFALLTCWFVLNPIFENIEYAQVDNSPLDAELKKERLFIMLEELEHEKILERTTEENYQISKQEIFAEISKNNLKRDK